WIKGSAILGCVGCLVGHLFMFLVGGKTPDQSVHLNLTTTLSRLAVGRASPHATRHLKLSVLSENTGGDQALMNEMLETFRDASAADLQAAGQAIARHEPQIFLRALHRLHGSAQILGITALQQLCAPFEAKRPDSLTPASCLEVVQRITGVMREIDGEIDALIGR
ncbi:Hpt domain-containing protein, partial [Klebsiella pneumoniae]|nr:Hpt domain-containing protein [Klebsiella pneumoniae]MCF1157760.1 Hpt domain-containing protein [Klebsiella pneumoniae]MCL3210713.1 Hpt domain-containing protein [Klebsiella pneumoniae]MCL3238346.1 Hpt domain-containing protein [Klebsiella pneumoniae]MCL3244303.1 Hpt domain-containing protein [Klebsiella pneumoniae]